MFSALLYLQVQSLRNRLWQRLRRLRNPRYLFGALFGVLYLASFFPGASFSFQRGAHSPGSIVTPETWEFVWALALLGVFTLIWLVPHGRAALVFSEAEIAFLFPAPIRRQTLVHFKLVRSQTAVLFTVLFLTLFRGWTGGVAGALMRAAGYWIVLSTINLHIIGSSFARTLLLERGMTSWQRRALVLTLLGGVAGVAVFWTGRDLPSPPSFDGLPGLKALPMYLGEIARQQPLSALLMPLRWIVRPYLASSGNTQAFWWSLGPALGVLALHYLWVVRSDVAFEEASLAASQRHAMRTAAVREGRGLHARPHRRRRPPFRLAPTGPPAVALLWKNLLSAGQLFNPRLALTLLGWSAIIGFSTQAGASHTHWPSIIGSMALVLGAWSVILGPQFVRQDFRQDLAAADLLKLYPVPAWQMALGELLAPMLILTVLQWVFIVLAAILFTNPHSGHILFDEDTPAFLTNHWSMAVSAAVIVPPLNLVSLLVPNAAALLFPAWFATGPGGQAGGRGIEVMGQRLIFILGQFLVQICALVPPALAAFVFYMLIASTFFSAPLVLPLTALVAAAVLAAEALGGLTLLGHWFEQFDLSGERPA